MSGLQPLTVSGIISGNARLTLEFDHTVVILTNADNSFTGGVCLNTATLVVAADHALPGAPDIESGHLKIDHAAETIGNLSGIRGSVTVDGGVLTISGAGTTTFKGGFNWWIDRSA